MLDLISSFTDMLSETKVKIEAVGSSETSVSSCKNSRRHRKEDHDLN